MARLLPLISVVVVVLLVQVSGDSAVLFNSGIPDYGVPVNPSIFCPNAVSCARGSLRCFRHLLQRYGGVVFPDNDYLDNITDVNSQQIDGDEYDAISCNYFPRCADGYVDAPHDTCIGVQADGSDAVVIPSFKSIADCIPVPGQVPPVKQLAGNDKCLSGFYFSVDKLVRNFVAATQVPGGA